MQNLPRPVSQWLLGLLTVFLALIYFSASRSDILALSERLLKGPDQFLFQGPQAARAKIAAYGSMITYFLAGLLILWNSRLGRWVFLLASLLLVSSFLQPFNHPATVITLTFWLSAAQVLLFYPELAHPRRVRENWGTKIVCYFLYCIAMGGFFLFQIMLFFTIKWQLSTALYLSIFMFLLVLLTLRVAQGNTAPELVDRHTGITFLLAGVFASLVEAFLLDDSRLHDHKLAELWPGYARSILSNMICLGVASWFFWSYFRTANLLRSEEKTPEPPSTKDKRPLASSEDKANHPYAAPEVDF